MLFIAVIVLLVGLAIYHNWEICSQNLNHCKAELEDVSSSSSVQMNEAQNELQNSEKQNITSNYKLMS